MATYEYGHRIGLDSSLLVITLTRPGTAETLSQRLQSGMLWTYWHGSGNTPETDGISTYWKTLL